MGKFKRVSIIWRALLWIYNGINIFLLHENRFKLSASYFRTAINMGPAADRVWVDSLVHANESISK